MKKLITSFLLFLTPYSYAEFDSKNLKSGIVTGVMIYVTFHLFETFLAHAWKIEEQMLDQKKASQERKVLEIKGELEICLLNHNKYAGNPDLVNGVPRDCVDLYNQFLVKAGTVEADEMIKRYKEQVIIPKEVDDLYKNR
jgi:hypothetical protein